MTKATIDTSDFGSKLCTHIPRSRYVQDKQQRGQLVFNGRILISYWRILISY